MKRKLDSLQGRQEEGIVSVLEKNIVLTVFLKIPIISSYVFPLLLTHLPTNTYALVTRIYNNNISVACSKNSSCLILSVIFPTDHWMYSFSMDMKLLCPFNYCCSLL